jgi:hypothetical protein
MQESDANENREPGHWPETRSEEYLCSVSEAAARWISSADSKAAVMMAIASGLLGLFVGAGQSEQSWTGSTALVLRSAFVAMASLTIAVAAWSLWPRTERRRVLAAHGKTRDVLHRSPTYFGDVAKLSYAEFLTAAEEPRASLQTKDRAEQTYVLSLIAAQKMRLIKVSVILLVGALVVLGALALLERPRSMAAGSRPSEMYWHDNHRCAHSQTGDTTP